MLTEPTPECKHGSQQQKIWFNILVPILDHVEEDMSGKYNVVANPMPPFENVGVHPGIF